MTSHEPTEVPMSAVHDLAEPDISVKFQPGVEDSLRGLLLWSPSAPYHSSRRVPVGTCTVAVLRDMAIAHPDWEFSVAWVQDSNVSIRVINRRNDRINRGMRIGSSRSNTVWSGVTGPGAESSCKVKTGQEMYDFIRESVERCLEE